MVYFIAGFFSSCLYFIAGFFSFLIVETAVVLNVLLELTLQFLGFKYLGSYIRKNINKINP